jgi:hypothetical protein
VAATFQIPDNFIIQLQIRPDLVKSVFQYQAETIRREKVIIKTLFTIGLLPIMADVTAWAYPRTIHTNPTPTQRATSPARLNTASSIWLISWARRLAVAGAPAYSAPSTAKKTPTMLNNSTIGQNPV